MLYYLLHQDYYYRLFLKQKDQQAEVLLLHHPDHLLKADHYQVMSLDLLDQQRLLELCLF